MNIMISVRLRYDSSSDVGCLRDSRITCAMTIFDIQLSHLLLSEIPHRLLNRLKIQSLYITRVMKYQWQYYVIW